MDNIDASWLCWVVIEEKLLLHEARDVNWQSLAESRAKNNEFLAKASEIITGLEGAWLDSEEAIMVRETLGDPPEPTLPIYLIGLEKDGVCGDPVYIGITLTSSRFTGGHKAALCLHHPKYNGYAKHLYRAAVWFHNGNEYLPLEWLEPEETANRILESIESQLIFEFMPAINVQKKKNECATIPLEIHIENFCGDTFIRDHIVFPTHA
tara:strand:- start:777 stop:1403 length:627 start_codon:yes stop_codon:yes gene_type:complete